MLNKLLCPLLCKLDLPHIIIKKRKSILKYINFTFPLLARSSPKQHPQKKKNNGAIKELLPNDIIEINFNPINN